MVNWLSAITKVKLLLLWFMLVGLISFGQEDNKKVKTPKKAREPRLERKALGYEENIKKIKEKAREMLDEEKVNYTKLDKLKRKVEKLSTKAKKCRYKAKSKRHVKVQDSSTKKRIKRSLKTHRKLKSNRRKLL